MTRRIRAFDPDRIHAGNRGLAVDHDHAARETAALLARMTPEQLFHEIRGHQAAPVNGLYGAGGDESLGIPAWWMVDGPRGARAGTATAFPVAIARGATFDPELERRVGLAIGLEVAARGGNVLLAPTINLLRHPGWGRAQETYSEDPFHMGAMAVAFVSGAQNHVLTSPKHFALNNLENTRFDLSAEIDARTLHEVYLPHFRRVVMEAAAGSIMSAYNRMNGVYCGEHRELLHDILRERWGFTGFVESDWFLGTRSTAKALNAGLDIEMPAGYRFSDENLRKALDEGELDLATVAERAGHSLYQKIAWNVAELPRPDPAVLECAEHLALAREVAAAGMVLLKNDGGLLPLADDPGLRIAVVGDLADTINIGDRGSSFVTSSEVVTPLAGLRARAAKITYFASDASDADLAALSDHDVAIVVAGLTFREEGEFIPMEQEAAESAGFARGGDRATLALPEAQRALIERTAAHARRTLVVLEGGSAITMRDWVDRVDGVLMAWYPGCQGGHAVADVIFGDVEPGGRLPVAVPRDDADLQPWDIAALSVPHGLLHGQRWLDHHQRRAEYPFGFGLGYTTFRADELTVTPAADGLRVSVRITNTGARAGATVVQVYASAVDSSVERVDAALVAFGRAALDAGESAIVELDVAGSDLAYFDISRDDWTLEACRYRLAAGFSAVDLPLQATWQYTGTAWQAAT